MTEADRSRQHLNDETIGELAASPGTLAEESNPAQSHLLDCADCRARLAVREPAALFALLNASIDRTAIPARPDAASWPVRRRSHLWSGVAAAALLALVALTLVTRVRPRVEPFDRHLAASSSTSAPFAHSRVRNGLVGNAALESSVVGSAVVESAVVEKVYSPTAQILSLVPPDGTKPTLTLIVDSGVDL